MSEDPTKVLVVDEDDNARAALCELLRDAGYEVAVARSGLDALRRTTVFTPDVLITEVELSDMAGTELGGLMPARPGAPAVLYMSAGPAPLGPALCFEKPLDVDALLDALDRLSARLRARNAACYGSGDAHQTPARGH